MSKNEYRILNSNAGSLVGRPQKGMRKPDEEEFKSLDEFVRDLITSVKNENGTLTCYLCRSSTDYKVVTENEIQNGASFNLMIANIPNIGKRYLTASKIKKLYEADKKQFEIKQRIRKFGANITFEGVPLEEGTQFY
jgi:DNA replication protein DnaD